MNHERRLEEAQSYASDVGVLGILQAITRLRGLILLPVIARVLGTGPYGVWTQALVAVSLGSSIVDLQLRAALVRFVSGTADREEQRRYFVPLLLIVAGLGALAAAATAAAPDRVARHILGDPGYAGIAAWLGAWIGVAAVGQFALHTLRALQRVKLFGVLNTAQVLGQLALVAAVVLIWRDLYVAVLAAIALELAFALTVLMLAVRAVGLGWPGFGRMRPALAYSLPLVPSHYAGITLTFADRLVIASQLGAEAVGVYAAAHSLARVLREIYKPVSAALLPAVSRMWDRGDHEQGRWLLANTMRYYLLLALPALVGAAALGPRVLRALAPGTVTAEARFLISMLGLGLLLASLRSVFSVLLELLKDTKALAAARVISATVFVLLIALVVPRWGLVGGALASGIGYGLDLAITSRLAWGRDRFELPWRAAAKAAFASGGMLLVVLLSMRLGGVWGLALALLAGLLSYALLMLAVGGVGRREVKFLLRAAGVGEPTTLFR